MIKIKEKKIKFKRGSIKTPFFMPDATRGFVKFLDNNEVLETGINAMVVNTFHLYLNPGLKIIKKAGGIHNFMNWKNHLLSDSGGFQVFSLIHNNSKMGKISDEGVIFKSPLDGSVHELTPEKSIQIQFDLGTDMMVCFDDCAPYAFSEKEMEDSVLRTVAWAKRCKKEYDKQIKKRKISKEERPLLFSVIQGGKSFELRKKCFEELVKEDFDGYGFGGRPVDENGKFLKDILKFTADLIPDDKLKFALGVGMPKDIKKCVKMGWNMFDCVIPTREGRHGRLFYFKNKKDLGKEEFYKTININNSKFSNDFSFINEESKIKELKLYSKAYLHHLFKLKDPLGSRLASLNNLEFYVEIMKLM